MMRFLAISLLYFTIVLTSCSLKTTQGLRQVPSVEKEVGNPYFSNPEIDYVYKAKINVYGRNLGGILIIKKLGPEKHRVVFTTEFGSKLFDFQFEGGSFSRNFVAEELDKKFIVNVLKDDFKLLISERAQVLETYESATENIFKTKSDTRFNFYFVDKESERLEKIVNTSKTKEKVEVNFSFSKDGPADIADTIVIKHNNIKLKIDLHKFKEQ